MALRGEVDRQGIRWPSPGRGPDDRSCWARVTSSYSVFIYARWQREGRRVRIAYAPEGKGFNDLLMERRA